jgi:cation diffusion facilitator CzcD-associated flavoprotein CzcO
MQTTHADTVCRDEDVDVLVIGAGQAGLARTYATRP